MSLRIIRPNPGHIILPRRFVDVEVPQGKMGVQGKFRLKSFYPAAVRADGSVAADGVIRETPWFSNLILDAGLNRWGTGHIVSGAAIGTGSSAPAVGQTQLDTLAHWTTDTGTGHNTFSAAGASPYNNQRVHVYRTTLGALNGNYTEVGAGWGSTTLFSRELIRDALGDPATFPVTSDQQVDIEYALQVYPPLTDFTDTITITGSGNHDVTGRAAYVNSSSHWGVNSGTYIYLAAPYSFAANDVIGVITSGPSGSTGSASSGTSDTYNNNSLTRTGYLTFGLVYGNVSGGIKSMLVSWARTATFQYEYDPVIAKDATKTLVLNFSTSWARH